MIDFEKIGREAIIAVYGKVPEAPKGFEFTGEFRLSTPKWNGIEPDMALPITGKVMTPEQFAQCRVPLLILRRKMVRRVVGWIVRKLGRPPQVGELFIERKHARISSPPLTELHDFEEALEGDEAVSCAAIYEETPEPTE